MTKIFGHQTFGLVGLVILEIILDELFSKHTTYSLLKPSNFWLIA